jgi:hypothetical protein
MKRRAGEFDVFLCHNDEDKPAVRRVHELLQERGILPWLDELDLRPGCSWQEELEKQIESIKAAAVFLGPNGVGPWQNWEMRAFLSEFVRRRCPVIPVLLPGSATPRQPMGLPIFLKGLTWVDLRYQDEVGIDRLAWGIKGEKPEQP